MTESEMNDIHRGMVGRGRRLDWNSKSTSLNMIVTRAWMARVTAYAKRQKITRSEAIRRLVDVGVGAPAPVEAEPRPPQS